MGVRLHQSADPGGAADGLTPRGAINVVTLANGRYAIPLAVMVRSLLDRLEPKRQVHVVVIDGGIPLETKQKLIDSWRTSAHLRAHQYRSLLPNAGRAILLDSDVLLRAGLGRLWDTPLDGVVAAAVADPFVPSVCWRRMPTI